MDIIYTKCCYADPTSTLRISLHHPGTLPRRLLAGLSNWPPHAGLGLVKWLFATTVPETWLV